MRALIIYMTGLFFGLWNTTHDGQAPQTGDIIEVSVYGKIATGTAPPDVQMVIEEGYFFFTFNTDCLQFLEPTYYWVPLSCCTGAWDDPGVIFAFIDWSGDSDWPLWVYSAWWHSPTKLAGMKFRVIAPGNCVFHWLYDDTCTKTTVFTLGRTQNWAGPLTDYTLFIGAIRGDCNGDGMVNNQDIDGFAVALMGAPNEAADMNYDGHVNAQDIDLFVEELVR